MLLHLTSIDNIVDGSVQDPTLVKHGITHGKRISNLFWWIDPVTHLNLDFPTHLMTVVFMALSLEKVAKMLTDGSRFFDASVDSGAYQHFGRVDLVGRRHLSLRQAVHM